MAGAVTAPDDPAAARGIARRAQSDIYRAGISGARPAVPTQPGVLEEAARAALSSEAFAYIAGGAGAERTVAANRAAFERWQVWPRPLRDVSARDLGTRFLGVDRPTPLLLAPLGVMELAHPDADLAVARAAAAMGVPYVLSNQASVPMAASTVTRPPRPARSASSSPSVRRPPASRRPCSTVAATGTPVASRPSPMAPVKGGWHCE